MTVALRLWALMIRRRSTQSLPTLLMMAGIATATFISVLTVAANIGLQHREDRTAWRYPEPPTSALLAADGVDEALPESPPAGAAYVLTTTRYADGDTIVRTDYAAVDGKAPRPPGLAQTPAPGEVFVSPALAELVESRVDSSSNRAVPVELRDYRNPTGLIDSGGLMHDDELVAVMGRSSDDPVFHQTPGLPIWRLDEVNGPGLMTELPTTATGSPLNVYQLLSGLGSVLLLVPAVSMIGGTVRMLTSRRSVELSRLRLVGATSRQVGRLALLDTLWVAIIGTLLGLALSFPGLAFFSRIAVGGGAWYPSDLYPGAAVLALIGVASVTIALLSTLATLRRVAISPLGVVTNADPGRAGWFRLLALVGAVGLFAVIIGDGEQSTVIVLGAWAALMASTLIVGPLLVRTIGSIWAWLARGGTSLLAARRLLDDPSGVYRQVGGLALASLIAGVLTVSTGVVSSPRLGDDRTLTFGVVSDTPAATVDQLVTELGPLSESVEIDEPIRSFPRSATVVLPDGADANTEQVVREVIAAHLPSAVVATDAESMTLLKNLIVDFQKASLWMMAVAGVAAAIGVGAQLATSIIDNRKGLTAIRMAGVSVSDVARSRRWAVMVPVVFATLGAGGIGVWAGALFADVDLSVRPFATLLAVTAVALAMTLLAEAASRPLLHRYTNDRTILDG